MTHKTVMAVALTFVAAGAAAAYVSAESNDTSTPASSPSGEPSAFRRASVQGDTLPSGVQDGVGRLAGGADASRRLARIGDRTIFASRSGADGICLGVQHEDSNIAETTCHSLSDISKGYVYSTTGDDIVGLGPDDVATVEFVDEAGSVVSTAKVVDDAYSAAGVLGKAAFLRFRTAGQETVVRLPPAP